MRDYIDCPHCKTAGRVDSRLCPICVGGGYLGPDDLMFLSLMAAVLPANAPPPRTLPPTP